MDPVGLRGFTDVLRNGDNLNRFTWQEIRISGQDHTGSFFRVAFSIIDVS